MPVRIVSDENLPIEYFDVVLNNQFCFFSTIDGQVYDEAQASENNGNIDLVFFIEEHPEGLIFVLFAPILLTDPNFVGEEGVLDWGYIPTEFRKVQLSSDDFDELMDITSFNGIFEAGELTPYIYDAPDGSHCTSYDQTIAVNNVIGFRGAYETTGFIRIKEMTPDSMIIDVKTQAPAQ